MYQGQISPKGQSADPPAARSPARRRIRWRLALRERTIARMRATLPPRRASTLVALLLFALSACKLISDYDALSYKNATDLRVETLALLDQGSEPYAGHAAEVAALRLKLKQAHEYEHRKGELNKDSAAQWAVLNDPASALQRTFDAWKTSGRLNEAFVEEAKLKAGALFDEIIRLERAKAE